VQGLPSEGVAGTRQYAPSIPTRPGYVAALTVKRLTIVISGWSLESGGCPACASGNNAEFPSELMIHHSGVKNVDKPCVCVIPNLLVCLNCGFARFTINRTELGLLTAGTQDGLNRGEQVVPGRFTASDLRAPLPAQVCPVRSCPSPFSASTLA
jgi:hypothetical protein